MHASHLVVRHLAGDSLGQEKRSPQVHSEQAIVFLRRNIENVAACSRLNARVVDQTGERPMLGPNAGDHGSMAGGLGNVERDKVEPPSLRKDETLRFNRVGCVREIAATQSKPPRARWTAMARPMPRLAPVINASGRDKNSSLAAGLRRPLWVGARRP